ncbi:MAG TPA: hypothetical protein VMV20_08010, partial [Chitinophagaceae bacterium]|nr:hypothetical protein [Chitinophagaceae bacterium]
MVSLKVIGIDRNLISPEAFNQKLLAKAWFNANIIIWFTIFVYPLFTILDFIYAGTIWQVFFVLRVFVALVLYAFHEFAVKTRRPPYGIMHLGLVL